MRRDSGGSMRHRTGLYDRIAGFADLAPIDRSPAHKEDIPCPPADVGSSTVEDLRAISEAVSVLIDTWRLFIVQADRINAQFVERMEFTGLRNAVVICIQPKSK